MKAYKIALEIKCFNGEYFVCNSSSKRMCWLCKEDYEMIVGKEVVGNVTFILHRLKGRARGYIFPFRFRDTDLEVHNGYKWDYAKSLEMFQMAFNTDEAVAWAGKSMFSIEMEW